MGVLGEEWMEEEGVMKWLKHLTINQKIKDSIKSHQLPSDKVSVALNSKLVTDLDRGQTRPPVVLMHTLNAVSGSTGHIA